MTDTLLALILYSTWMIILLVVIASYRSFYTLAGKKAANSFDPDGSDVSKLSGRLCRAHANCYEFFPIAGGLLLAALATGNTGLTDPLAMYFIEARLLQSAIHIISTSVIAVYVRFALFLAQAIICAYWVMQFLQLPEGLTSILG